MGVLSAATTVDLKEQTKAQRLVAQMVADSAEPMADRKAAQKVATMASKLAVDSAAN